MNDERPGQGQWHNAMASMIHDVVHVYFDYSSGPHLPHDLTGDQCWCRPDCETRCPDCSAFDQPDPNCGRCGGDGYVDGSNPNFPRIIHHRKIRGEIAGAESIAD